MNEQAPVTQKARRLAGRGVKGLTRRLGYDLVRIGSTVDGAFIPPEDCDEFTAGLMLDVRPYTLTSPERIMALVEAVRHLVRNEVPGAFVECGVWRGGSVLVMLRTLMSLGVTDRDLYLYDTFTHMPEPGEHDVDFHGRVVADYYEEALTWEAFKYLPYGEVVSLIEETGYPRERLHFVQGMVEETLPQHAPERLALCRLDTDWYESTAHELEHLYPRLARGGVLIIDDYGHFLGARKATDEYFAQHGEPVFLNRIDFSGRLVVKP